jgi:hypothetical protein
MKKVGPLGGILREQNKDTQIVYHRIYSLGGSSICNSLPYIDSKTAPKGAKLQLYGVCDEVVVQDLSATTVGYFMSGLCPIYNSIIPRYCHLLVLCVLHLTLHLIQIT